MKAKIDAALDRKVMRLQEEVKVWSQNNGLWRDCDFFDYTARVRPVDWDETGYVTVFAAEGDISRIAISRDHGGGARECQLSEEFDRMLRKHGFWYENYDHTEMWIYATDPAVRGDFKEHMRWKWICSLIKPEFDLLDQELYSHFRSNPNQLEDLHWRDFEKIVAALLESQGYQIELGPGQNDGGVDIRLIQRDPIGDIMTLVQVKRYRRDLKVRLGAVQALHGAAAAEGVAKSMFVTTSTFAPSAEKFAERENVPMTLHTSHDVQQWCAEARAGIIEDKRNLVGESHMGKTLQRARHDSRQVLVGTSCNGMVVNKFALVVKETRTGALLLELPTRISEHDGYKQRGREVPELHALPKLSEVGKGGVMRARRAESSGRRFWDGSYGYSPWDGVPVHFDYCD